MSEELKAAADRLRHVAYAECDEDARQHADDCKILAHAYLALGERRGDSYAIEVGGAVLDGTSTMNLETAREDCLEWVRDGSSDAKIVRVITFTQEVPSNRKRERSSKG